MKIATSFVIKSNIKLIVPNCKIFLCFQGGGGVGGAGKGYIGNKWVKYLNTLNSLTLL